MKNLEKIIKENNLVLPDYHNINLVDLVKTIYKIKGIKYKNTKNIEYLESKIPKNKHILLVLSDGTGSNVINGLNDNSILKKNKIDDILTVFPSTTGCALTSLVTATYPKEHGIWGWFNYNREFDIDYYSLLFLDRKNKKSLKNYNITSNDIYKTRSILNKLNTKVNVLFPSDINNSEYSKFVANDDSRYPYNNYNEIIEFMKRNCKTESDSFTYLYLTDIDDLEHDNGIDSEIVKNKLLEIDTLIYELSKNDDLTIVFTADHGQTNVNEYMVLDFNKYSKYFYAYPSIDYGTATYYIKDIYKKEFEKNFLKDFKDKMFLFKTADFIKYDIFGIGNFDEYALNNLGEYISICKESVYLINNPNFEDYYGKIKGNHSGLSKNEMIIPLIIIDSNNIK